MNRVHPATGQPVRVHPPVKLHQVVRAAKWRGRAVSVLRGLANHFHLHLSNILGFAGRVVRSLWNRGKAAPKKNEIKPVVADAVRAALKGVNRVVVPPPMAATPLSPEVQHLQETLTAFTTTLGVSVYNRVIKPQEVPALLAQELTDELQAAFVKNSGGLEAEVVSLVKGKIANFFQMAIGWVLGPVTGEVKQMVEGNATIVGQNLSARLASLLQALTPTPYQKAFNGMVGALYAHIKGLDAVSDISDPNLRRAAFAKQSCCYPTLKPAIDPQTGVVDQSALDPIQRALCSARAKKLIALLLPDQEGVSGVVALMRQLQVVPSLQNSYHAIFNHLPGWGQQVCQKATDLLENSVAVVVTPQIQKGVAMGLKMGIDQAAQPANLDLWMAKGAFPATFQALAQAFVVARLNDPSHAISKALDPLADSTANFQTTCDTLIPLLYQDLVTRCKDLDFTKTNLDQKAFAVLMAPYLQSVASYFQQQLKPGKSPDVKGWLRAFNKPVDAGDNPFYGKMLMDFLFHLGNFKVLGNKALTEKACHAFLQSLMSRALTSVMFPFSSSDTPLIQGLDAAIQKIGDEPQLEAMIFDPAASPGDVPDALNQQFSNLGILTRDLVRQFIDQIKDDSSIWTKFFKNEAVKVIKDAMPDQDAFSKLYRKVYTGISQDSFINASLYYSVLDLVYNTLAQTDS